jgi:hypothetical protein
MRLLPASQKILGHTMTRTDIMSHALVKSGARWSHKKFIMLLESQAPLNVYVILFQVNELTRWQ